MQSIQDEVPGSVVQNCLATERNTAVGGGIG